MICQIVQNEDGTIVVRDFFSGKTVPLEEASNVLSTLKKEEGSNKEPPVPFVKWCPTARDEVAE